MIGTRVRSTYVPGLVGTIVNRQISYTVRWDRQVPLWDQFQEDSDKPVPMGFERGGYIRDELDPISGLDEILALAEPITRIPWES